MARPPNRAKRGRRVNFTTGPCSVPAEGEDQQKEETAMSRAFVKETAESAAPPERMVDEGRGVARVAREQVQWTCENDERAELERSAGPAHPPLLKEAACLVLS